MRSRCVRSAEASRRRGNRRNKRSYGHLHGWEKFTQKVNEQLREIWTSRVFEPNACTELRSIESKLTNMHQAIENGLPDVRWANARLRELLAEKQQLESRALEQPPQIEVTAAMAYRRNAERLFQHGEPAERQRLVRSFVEAVSLKPDDREVQITYRLPEFVM